MRSSLVSKESVFSTPWRYVKSIYSYVFAGGLFILEQSKVKMTVRLNVLNRTTGRIMTDPEIIISALLLSRSKL